MADAYAAKPWLELYTPGIPKTFEPRVRDLLSLFAAAAARAGDGAAIHYFDRTISYRELDAMSDALAAALIARGFAGGDRLAVYLQNMPPFLIACLAAWKAGGIVVPVNPMNREHELTLQFADSEPKALVCLDTLWRDVVSPLPAGVKQPDIVVAVSSRDFQSRNDARVFGPTTAPAPGAPLDLSALLLEYAGQRPPARPSPSPDAPAFLVYTSGTTGLPKAAMNTHANIAVSAAAVARWYSLADGDAILGMAPLFHVTGLVAHVALSWTLAAPLILLFRFEPGVALDALLERKPAWTVSAITAFIALMNNQASTPDHWRSLKAIVSGGAPIPPSVVETFEAQTGRYIHNGYGLTETSAGVIAVPHKSEAPVDGKSGALAIGVPKFGVAAWIAGDDGQPAKVGETGEIVVSGPTVAPGYWRKPEETAQSMRPDGFRTGDVGFMDAAGWFYLVDRKKDMIVASGFKVWPREVEDVLYSHPAVREVAVVGIADDYRGESVKAVVALKAGANATEAELIDWCGRQLAAYKRPHKIEIRDELPKTITGKILRRLLK
jgi:long-chain acyl-CoA synthetase